MSGFIKMENNTSILSILNELAQAKDLLQQLESDLHAPVSTNGKLLIPQILSYFENSLSMLSETGNQSLNTGSETASTPTDSPRSVNGGGRRRDYESDLIGSPGKKRKTLPRWTEKVRVCEETGLEGPLEDGYSWRKYGQKDIHGATYPRGYYRCAHRNARGCFATKQVQRSDEDTSVFRVTFCGRHTCIQAPNLLLPGQSQKRAVQKDQKPTNAHETIINFGRPAGGKVVPSSPPFSFPSNPLSVSCTEKENNSSIFSSMAPGDHHFRGSHFSSSSPSTSGSNSVSSYGVNNFEGGKDLQTSEYGVDEFTSALDSPGFCLDFDFLDSNFQFDF